MPFNICSTHGWRGTGLCPFCENDRKQSAFEKGQALGKALLSVSQGVNRADGSPAQTIDALGFDVRGERVAIPPKADNVNNPAHYTAGGIECIDAIQAALTPEEYRGYLKGNVMKYMWREKHKGGEESLRKAEWYLKRLIALGLALGALAGCGSDYCSPFDKPDETVMPVACAASTPCQQ